MKEILKISIVITYYNKGSLLYNALESIYKQTAKFFEIILVNDGSNDKESQLVWHEIEKSNLYKKKLNLFELKENYGASYAKNFGIKKASGDIIVLLDADDILPSTAVEIIIKAFQEHSDASLIFGNYSHNNETVDCSVLCDNNNELNIPILLNKWILLGTSPFKKNAFEEIGGFNILYPKIDDTDFHLRLLLGGYVFKYINQNIYTWNDVQNSNGKNVKREDCAKLFFRNIDIFMNNLTTYQFFIRLFKNFLIIIIERIFSKN